LREEALKDATLLCRCPSCSHVEETSAAASFAANALSALLPHNTRYNPIMINTAPIILHKYDICYRLFVIKGAQSVKFAKPSLFYTGYKINFYPANLAENLISSKKKNLALVKGHQYWILFHAKDITSLQIYLCKK
jgi:hypothetical protein